MAKEGGYIQIKSSDIGPFFDNRWPHIQAFYDYSVGTLEYGSVVQAMPGNYFVKLMLLDEIAPGPALPIQMGCRITTNTPLPATGTLMLVNRDGNNEELTYTAYTLNQDLIIFDITKRPLSGVKQFSKVWTTTPEVIDTTGGDGNIQFSVADGVTGLKVEGIPPLGDAGGCRIVGDTLTVYSIKGVYDKYDFYQEAINDLQNGVLGIPIPTAANEVWLFIEYNVNIETITITNQHLSVELVSGLRGITVIKNY